jgi:hypothetical protein
MLALGCFDGMAHCKLYWCRIIDGTVNPAQAMPYQIAYQCQLYGECITTCSKAPTPSRFLPSIRLVTQLAFF